MRYHEAMKTAVKLGLVLACALLVAFPTTARKKKKGRFVLEPRPTDIVWPSPPQEPIIRFLGSYWGDINFPPSKKKRFRRRLLGERPPDRRLHRPFDVAVDSELQRIYASDYAYIGVFDIANKEYSHLMGEPPAVLQYVMGLTVDGEGNLYAVDARAKSVVVFSPDLVPVKAYGSLDMLEHPVDAGVNDELGRVYVSDSKANAVHVFSKEEGELLFSFGSLGIGEGQFYRPSHIWVDREGLVYVTDFLNFRVQAFDADGEFLFKIGSIGTNPGQFSKPKGVAVDSEGHIYVADSAFGNVQIFDRSGRILLTFSNHGWNEGEMRLPAGIFIDEEDHIYVADSVNGRVCAFDFLGVPETLLAPVEEEPQREAAPAPAIEKSPR
jgi:DNA-binding beta-propeller fold protein YncE